jgi:hypothetical protein
VDHASGFHVYRNVAYNNAFTGYLLYGVWRDGPMVYVNNVAANGLYGMSLGGAQYDTHGMVDTRVINNILVNNEAFGLSMGYAEGRVANATVDHNLYHNNGWRSYDEGGIWHAGAMVIREGGAWEPYETLAAAQAATPWEEHGLAGDPAFWDYDPTDHALYDDSRPDFHLTGSSAAIDQGTASLPASLLALLDAFDIEPSARGAAYDIGRYEAGFTLRSIPSARTIEAGGDAHYTLSLDPPDLPHPVTLSVGPTAPDLATALSAGTLALTDTVTLTVTHLGPASAQWYTIPITAAGGGFVSALDVALLVDGHPVYLPLVSRGSR